MVIPIPARPQSPLSTIGGITISRKSCGRYS